MALAGRTIVGYQGWFGCPTENTTTAENASAVRSTARWRHWFDAQIDDAVHLTVDMLPDVSVLPRSALCPTGLRRHDGSTVAVFSSANTAVVDIHFGWMKAHDIDGAAVQRFVSPLRDRAERDRSDAILKMIRAAAEAHDRVFYISYDISGADPVTVYDEIRANWAHLTDTLKIPASRANLSVQDKPMVQLWGFGFRDRPGEPEEVLRLESSAVALIGGVPSHWRNADGDSKRGAD